MKIRRREFLWAGGGGFAVMIASSTRAHADDVEQAAASSRVLLSWGTNGHGHGEFDIPIAIAVNQNDEILVTDFRQTNADAMSRVQRFDQEE